MYTDLKFVMIGAPQDPYMQRTLQHIYLLYTDFGEKLFFFPYVPYRLATFFFLVLKNAFYEMDMPIRCAKFDAALDGYARQISSGSTKGHEQRAARMK